MEIEQIKKFFFNAMIEGWAGNAKKILIPDLPGHKAISFQYGDFRLTDCYCKNVNTLKSAGTTTIWHKEIPVWFMSYGGSYQEVAISFLKEVLLKTYRQGSFFGGRGTPRVSNGTLLYKNNSHNFYILGDDRDHFLNFRGREEIVDYKDGFSYGYHDYWGMCLA